MGRCKDVYEYELLLWIAHRSREHAKVYNGKLYVSNALITQWHNKLWNTSDSVSMLMNAHHIAREMDTNADRMEDVSGDDVKSDDEETMLMTTKNAKPQPKTRYKVQFFSIDNKVIDERKINTILKMILTKLGKDAVLTDLRDAREGRYEDKGYHYIESLDISIRGYSSFVAYNILKRLNDLHPELNMCIIVNSSDNKPDMIRSRRYHNM